MIVKREEEIHPERNPLVRLFKRLMLVTGDYRGDRFFVREDGLRMATPFSTRARSIEQRKPTQLASRAARGG